MMTHTQPKHKLTFMDTLCSFIITRYEIYAHKGHETAREIHTQTHILNFMSSSLPKRPLLGKIVAEGPRK